MMELVDMQGLKPCPKQGPGSSPGVGRLIFKLQLWTKEGPILYVYFEFI